MKKTYIIPVIIATWLICLVGAWFLINWGIEKKDEKLFTQAQTAIREYFQNQTRYIDIVYSGKKVSYVQVPIPEKPKKKDNTQSFYPQVLYERDLEDWKTNYGDIYKLYDLKPRYKSEYSWLSDNEWTGWLFHGIESINGYIITEFLIYPYQVGLKRQNDYYGYYFMPSIQEAIDESFEFHTTNPKSSYIKEIVSGEESSIYTLEKMVNNEYYYLWSYDNYCKRLGKERADSIIRATDWSKYPVSNPRTPVEYYFVDDNNNPSNYGGMYSGYYTVNNKYQALARWEVKYNWLSDRKTYDLKKARIWCFAVLTFLMLGAVIPLTIIHKRREKHANEGLQDKLKRLCNPTNFIKQYDKDKVEKANVIYQQLLTNNLSNDTLMKLQAQAVAELGVTLIDKNRLAKLKAKLNPQNYMKPYNAEKVSLANELYSRVNKEGLTYEEFVEIEKEAQKL